jgi:hypothetical protein
MTRQWRSWDCRNTAGDPPGGSQVAAIVQNTAGFGRQLCFSHCRPISGRCRHTTGVSEDFREWPIAHCNKGPVYNILFHAAAETLQTIAADPKHLGAELGFFAVLHTWGQTLRKNPHS